MPGLTAAGNATRHRFPLPGDCFAWAAFFLFALLFQLGPVSRIASVPFLNIDAGTIASYAAGWNHPEIFAEDALLGETGNYRIYMTVHVPLVRAWGRLTGDYAAPFVSLVGLHTFLQGLGFYVLGKAVFRSRYFAFLLGMASLMPVMLNLGEFWGTYRNMLPRSTFQALLPFLLAAAFKWRRQPRRWPVVMVLAGLMMHVHPVSAPAWGLALWLGSWPQLPAAWPLGSRLLCLFGNGCVFLLAGLPFILNYLGNHAHGGSADYAAVYAVMKSHYGYGYFDIPVAAFQFAARVWPLLLAGLAAAVYLHRAGEASRDGLKAPLGWIAGLLLACVGIPLVEQALCRAFRLLPLEIDLVRGLRYLVPMMLLLCFWALAQAALRGPRRIPARAAALCLAALWILMHKPHYIRASLSCWAAGKWICADGVLEGEEGIVNAVKHLTPAQAKVLPAVWSLDVAQAIRYHAFRPLVYCQKDGGSIAYSDHGRLLEWHRQSERIEAIRRDTLMARKLDRLLGVSRELGADYLVVEGNAVPADLHGLPGRLIYAAPAYSLVRVAASRERPARVAGSGRAL